MRILFPLLSLAACASYPEKVSGALGNFEAGRFDDAMAVLSDEDRLGSAFLAGAEAGTVALAAGYWDLARSYFERAAAASADIEERALVGPEALGEALGSWVLSDGVRSYEGEGFERVYVHTSLALTYLAQGLLDDVYVEARLANRLLEAEEKLYETKYKAGGFGHLLSALTYELLGQPDQAYIDYERMEAKGLGTALAGRALVRLAKVLGRTEELGRWEESFGKEVERPAGAAGIVVLAGVGMGPYKVENSLNLYTPDGLFRIAVPHYRSRPQVVSGLRLIDEESGVSLRTERVEDVTAVAQKNLKDRLAWLTAKSALRSAGKMVLTNQLEEKYDGAGFLVGTLFTAMTERADLRAWMSLPDSWQACRLFVPPGTRTFTLEAIGGHAVSLGSYQLEPEETMFVFVRTLGPDIYAHVVGGQRVEPPIGEPYGFESNRETNSP
jgi:hypothetical protein